MTLKTRRIWFYILLSVFFIAGGGIIFYSQGWRIDFEELRIQKTGAIYLASMPRDATITINSRVIKNQSGLIQSGTLIGSLLPKHYEILLEKAGYRPWKKEIEVFRELVTAYEHIILLPVNEAEPVPQAAISAAREQAFAITYNPQRETFIYENLASKEKIDLSALFNALKEKNLGLPGIVPIKHILVHPQNSKILGVFTENALYLLDANARTIEKISSAKPKNGAVSARYIVWNESDESVKIYSFSQREIISLPPFAEHRAIKLGSSPSGETLAILDESGALFLFDPAGLHTKKISAHARNFEFSPNNQKIAVYEDGANMFVYDYAKEKYQRFSLPINDTLAHIAWHKDNAHLFLISSSALYFTEIDEALPLNIYLIADGIILLIEPLRNNFGLNTFTSVSELDQTNSTLYNASQDTLYFLKQNRLYRFNLRSASSK